MNPFGQADALGGILGRLGATNEQRLLQLAQLQGYNSYLPPSNPQGVPYPFPPPPSLSPPPKTNLDWLNEQIDSIRVRL